MSTTPSTVISHHDITLDATQSNAILDEGQDVQNFDAMPLGPITNGLNGWTFNGGAKDQAVVFLGGSNHGFHMSSDPAVGDFSGPYSPHLSAPAGEAMSGAAYATQSVEFDFQAINPGDNSRMEVDLGNTGATDRNNFLVIEDVAGQGLRIATNSPHLDGNWDTNDFSAFTGNVTLVSGVSDTVSHTLTETVHYVDGANNDTVSYFLDGNFIGQSGTFENYRDALGGTHLDNEYKTDSLFFRGGDGGQPQDGPGGQNQGFVFDNIVNTAYNDANATGNAKANIMVGNAGANTLSGLAGNDHMDGGEGNDNLIGGVGKDTLTGGAGNDHFVYGAFTETSVPLRDVITDFQEGHDKIDLSLIDANTSKGHLGDQAFTFVGTGAFHGAGQVRESFLAGNTILSGETAGTGTQFQIELTGIHHLTVGDFIL